jgi:chitinase
VKIGKSTKPKNASFLPHPALFFLLVCGSVCVLIFSPRNAAQAGVSVIPTAKQYEIVGYYPGWSSGDFAIDNVNIDAAKLTVINYAFLDICWNGKRGNPVDGGEMPCKDADGTVINPQNGSIVFAHEGVDAINLRKLAALKAANPGLRVLASVGGWVWSNTFSNVAESASTRENFVKSAVALIREYRLDGIDVDWEFPASIGLPCTGANICQRATDKPNFVSLVAALRQAFDAASVAEGRRLLITIAVGSNTSYVNGPGGNSPWITQLARNVDWINIMAYDFHGRESGRSGLVAPLYRDLTSVLHGMRTSCSDAAVSLYLQAGVPADKLVLGQPFYGYTWTDCSAGLLGDGLYQPCTGAGRSFDFFQLLDEGYLIKGADGKYTQGANGFVRYWNNAAQVPYLYNASTKVFFSYEDEASIRKKSDYIKSKGLRGAMFWELGADRYRVLSPLVFEELGG